MTGLFKYYIHDTARGFSLQLSGPFTEGCLADIACCWETAKSTLKHRTVTLDLRGVTSVDESARQWLAAMGQDGANYLPEKFLLETLAGLDRKSHSSCGVIKAKFFGRIFRFAPRTIH